MTTGLPELIDPKGFCEQGRVLSGTLSMKQMARLQAVVLEPLTDVEVDLQFSLEQQGLRVITGQVGASIIVECQRCLSPMEMRLDCFVGLQLVVDEEAADLVDDEWDPLIVSGDGVSLTELVEDELLVELPAVNLHDVGECQSPSSNALNGPVAGESIEPPLDKPNPFEVLAALKKSADE
ncbi:MAG: YceD family protein [Immundisolibacteraceae bacterium]|nr:YceD family protein [Immundisolibacteraceae bacterium]